MKTPQPHPSPTLIGGLLLLVMLTMGGLVGGEPNSIPGVQRSGGGGGNHVDPHFNPDGIVEGGQDQGDEVVDPREEDVGSLLINTLYTSPASSSPHPSQSQQSLIPEIEMKKLKAAAKGAGLSDGKADRVLRAVRALDLKYHQVVDLKKVMINPATSADYADRLRRALEDAVVDAHSKKNDDDPEDDGDGDDDSHRKRRNAPTTPTASSHFQPNLSKTVTSLADSDLQSPLGRSVLLPGVVVDALPPPLPPTLAILQSAHPAPPPPSAGHHLFFATPLTAPALLEDLDNLWILASHVLPQKEAFELVQLTYSLKLTRANVFDLQHEFAGGRLSPDDATKLLQRLRVKVAATPTPTTPNGLNPKSSPPPDLSKPLDPATLKRLQTVAELSGMDKDTSKRLVRAVVNSGLERDQVHEIGDVIQSSGASVDDLNKLLDHLEETDLHTYRKRGLLDQQMGGHGGVEGGEEVVDRFQSTPEQAKGADWIYSNGEEGEEGRNQIKQ